MRNRVGCLLVAALLLGSPAAVRAQYEEVAPSIFTAFLSHPRYEDGGFFLGMDFVYLRQNNTLGNQTIATRGFLDLDGSISHQSPPVFIGSGQEALNTQQLNGPRGFQPGFDLSLGWRFENGFVIQLDWLHLTDSRLSASASLLGQGFNVGSQLQNTFLFSPVYNFPIAYAGAPQNVSQGDAGATFGIWNAASQMQIELLQRFDMVSLTGRMPILQTENYRAYGFFGPRAVTMWDRFKWRTISMDTAGNATASTTADYTNIESNRLYGVFAGCGNEWFLGNTPIGGFSFSLDLEGGLYLDFVKERARYELEDHTTAATRSRNTYTLAPGVQGKVGFWYYPWEAVTLHIGWDALLFFNTIVSRDPVDFNLGGIDPQYDHATRLFNGLQLGVGFVF